MTSKTGLRLARLAPVHELVDLLARGGGELLGLRRLLLLAREQLLHKVLVRLAEVRRRAVPLLAARDPTASGSYRWLPRRKLPPKSRESR